MAEVTNRKINIYIETGAAQKAFDQLNTKAQALQKQMASTTDKGELAKLKKQLDALQQPLDAASKKLSGQMAPSMKELQKVVTELGNRMKRMSTNDADFSGVLKQYSQAKTQLQEIQAEVNHVANAQSTLGKAGGFLNSFFGNLAARGVEQVAGMVSSFFKGTIDEAMQAEEASARFQATLENIGHADLFGRITAQADAMAKKFRYLDNDDVVAVFNKLIDYGKLTEKQMDDLMPVIIDFAAKQRISIAESSDVIVKALEGNVKGLKTFGISLGDASTPAERLGVIMTDLKGKVDGAGEAFQKTAAGGIAVAKQQFKDLQEEIGNQVLPMLVKTMSFINDAIKGLRGITQAAEENAQAAKRVDEAAINDKLKVIDLQIKQGKLTKEQVIEQLELQRKAGTISNTGAGVLAALKPEVIGTGDPNKDENAEKAAEAKRKAAQDKVLADQQKLADELKKIAGDLLVFNGSEQEKELQQLVDKYAEMRKLAHGNHDQLKQLDELFAQEQLQIMVKYGRKELEEFEKLDKAKQEAREKAQQEAVQRAQQSLIRFEQILQNGQQRQTRDTTAGLELQILKSHGATRLKAQHDLLDQQMKQELANKDLTEKEKELIEEKYRQKHIDLERAHWKQVANMIMEFVGSALNVLDQFNQVQTQKENQQLEQDRKTNDLKKSNYDRQLKNKQITKQEYDRKVTELDKAQEKKERQAEQKQFRRNQRIAIAQALINGGQAASKTLSEWGMPFAIPFLALTAASIVAQIAAINAQKPPEMARGGLLKGPSHANGGIPAINHAGVQVAEVEGGEAITNKRTMADRGTYTVSGTPSQIISSLNGLHGGVQWSSGATLRPSWSTISPQRMNFEHINNSYRTVRMMANGGVLDDTPTSVATGGGDAQTLSNLVVVMNQLQQTLAGGIPAFLSLNNFENQVARKQAILDESTMK